MNKHCVAYLGLVACALGLSLFAPQRASAQTIYAGLLGGYAAHIHHSTSIRIAAPVATTSPDAPADLEPYGVGLGASAGVTMPVIPLYVGARVLYFLGDSAELHLGGTTTKVDTHYLMYGLDLGYDLALGPIVLRPGVGIGNAAHGGGFKTSAAAGGNGFASFPSASSFYIAPSLGALVKLGLIYVGGELRYNALTESTPPDSVSFLASVGVTF